MANDVTIERQRSGKDGKIELGTNDYWVARILEVRAADEHHVYARVFWMYSPDELPANTLDGRKAVAGRQPYHGANELIASNHSKCGNFLAANVANSSSGCHQRRERGDAGTSQAMDRIRRRRGAGCALLEAGTRLSHVTAFGRVEPLEVIPMLQLTFVVHRPHL